MDQEKLNTLIYLYPDDKFVVEHVKYMDLANETDHMKRHHPKVAIFLNFECIWHGIRNIEDVEGYEKMFKYNRHFYEPN